MKISLYLPMTMLLYINLLSCQTKPQVSQSSFTKKPRSFSSVRFIERYNSEDSVMSLVDRQYILNFENPQQRKMSPALEAALVLGLAKHVVSLPDESSALSFETMLIEKKLNLENILNNNKYVNDLDILLQIANAINNSRNSEGFTQTNLSILEAKKMSHTQDFDMAVMEESSLESTPELEDLPDDEQNPVLAKAQRLADENKLKEAIGIIKTLPSNSPHYREAQVNIVRMASLAVKQLRQKAALAFQNAVPLNDGDQKKQYLLEAKSYLEEALNSYPEAPSDQLSGIRKNLAVIEQDLSGKSSSDY
jgi:hypothetical protein